MIAASSPAESVPATSPPGPVLLRLVALVALALYGGLFLHAWWGHRPPFVADFGSHWVAATAAVHGQSCLPYDRERFGDLLQSRMGLTYPRWTYKYPPIHLALYAPLAALPHDWAFLLLGAISLIAMAAVLRMARCTWTQTLFLLAAPVTAKNLFHGQNGLLAGACLGAAFLVLHSRPALAGLSLALVSFKPHLLLVAPVALLAGGHRRALSAFFVSTACLAILSVAAFGVEPWARFAAGLMDTANATARSEVPLGRSFTFAAMLTLAGCSRPIILPLQVVLSVLVVTLAALVCRKPGVPALTKTLVVLLGTPLASPYGIDYDLGVLSVAAGLAWNSRDVRGDAALTWLVPLIWWLPPVTSFLGRTAGVQIASVCMTAMFLAVLVPAAMGPRDPRLPVEGR